MSSELDVYVVEWFVGGSAVRRVLVLDERKKGSRRLPSSGDGFEKIAEVCREIEKLHESKSWGEIGDMFNVSKHAIRSFYNRYCR